MRGGKRALIGAGLAIACLVATPAAALLVQPIMLNIFSSGTRSSGAITVVNDRNKPEAVEITVGKLALPEKGPPVITPDKGDDFLIFPPRATIQPGKTQVFRVRWIGEPILPESKMYMFTTAELPVSETGQNGIQLLYAIQSVVTVSSPALKADLGVASAVRSTRVPAAKPGDTAPPAPQAGLDVTFTNGGNAIDYLSHYKLKLSDPAAKWSKTLDPQEFGLSVGLGLLAPNSRRTLFIAVADAPAAGDVTATLERAPER